MSYQKYLALGHLVCCAKEQQKPHSFWDTGLHLWEINNGQIHLGLRFEGSKLVRVNSWIFL